MIEEIVTMEGIRIKPTESMLNDFVNSVRNLNIAVIGSMLLNKIKES